MTQPLGCRFYALRAIHYKFAGHLEAAALAALALI